MWLAHSNSQCLDGACLVSRENVVIPLTRQWIVAASLESDLHCQLHLPRAVGGAGDLPEGWIAHVESTAAIRGRTSQTKQGMVECILRLEAHFHAYAFAHGGDQELFFHRQVAGKAERRANR